MKESIEDNPTIIAQGREELDENGQQALDTVLLAAKIIPPVGLILNFIFLFVTIRVKSMHTIINVYLSNLAVADFLYLIKALISASRPLIPETDIVITIISDFFAETARCASFSFVTAIAVERFSAVHHPITFRSSASKTRAAKISTGLWALSVVFGVITSLLYNPKFATDYSPTITSCILIYYILTLIFNVATLTATATLYIYIVIKLCLPKPAPQQHPQLLGKVVCMLLINTAVFFLCNSMMITSTAFSILGTVQYLQRHPLSLYVDFKVFAAACILNMINSSINPLVYSATNSSYRAAVVKAFSSVNLAHCYNNDKTLKRPKAIMEQRRFHANGPRDAAKHLKQEQIELSAIGPRDAAQGPVQEQRELSAIGPREAAHQEPVQEQIELSAFGPMDAAQGPVQEQMELSASGPSEDGTNDPSI